MENVVEICGRMWYSICRIINNYPLFIFGIEKEPLQK